MSQAQCTKPVAGMVGCVAVPNLAAATAVKLATNSEFLNNLKGDGNMPFFAILISLSKSLMQSGGTGSRIGGHHI